MGCLVTWVTLVRWSLNFLPESITFLGVCVWGGGEGGGGGGGGGGRTGGGGNVGVDPKNWYFHV